MTAQYIGKGEYRIIVRSQRRLERIRKLPNVRITPDNRIIFRQPELKAVLREAMR